MVRTSFMETYYNGNLYVSVLKQLCMTSLTWWNNDGIVYALKGVLKRNFPLVLLAARFDCHARSCAERVVEYPLE